MSIVTQPLPTKTEQPPIAASPEIYRLSVEQYHQMIEHGILKDGDPVELLEGWLVQKMSKKRAHSISTQLTRDALGSLIPTGWHVASQDPVTTDDSEPEPDGSVIRGSIRDYAEHPGPKDTAMVVEVADTTLIYDRTVKKRIFARAKIPICWIVNLIDRQIEVYTDPTDPAEEPDYRQRIDYGESDEVPVFLDGIEVGRLAVRDVLP